MEATPDVPQIRDGEILDGPKIPAKHETEPSAHISRQDEADHGLLRNKCGTGDDSAAYFPLLLDEKLVVSISIQPISIAIKPGFITTEIPRGKVRKSLLCGGRHRSY